MSSIKIDPATAEKVLRDASQAIDQTLDWNNTDEGPDFWEQVCDALQDYANEAKAQTNGAVPTVAPSAPASGAIPPPLHTLIPKGKATPKWNPPPLDSLVGGRRTPANPVTAQPLRKEEIVHIWHNGGALCGLRGSYLSWPFGHFRVNMDEATKATCAACTAKRHEVTGAIA